MATLTRKTIDLDFWSRPSGWGHLGARDDAGGLTWTHRMDWVLLAMMEAGQTPNEIAWALDLEPAAVQRRFKQHFRASRHYNPLKWLP